jgi:hypothetical protein
VEKNRDFDPLDFISQPAGVLAVVFVVIAWFMKLDAVVFRAISRLCCEQSALTALREPTQIALFHYLGLIGFGLAMTLVIAWRRLSPHARCCFLIMMLAFVVRATIWIVGSNLPVEPGDGSHYVEIASSILRGEGPVKHYVESLFRDYPAIRRNEGVLDDRVTPLYSYWLAAAYRILGITPGDSLETTFAVAKGSNFVLNLATLPVLYFFTRRRYGSEVALQSVAVLAILPVHAVYAGLELRESLATLMTLLAVGAFSEMTNESRSHIGWLVTSGIFTGLSILSRDTGWATGAACGLYGLIAGRRRNLRAMAIWGSVLVLVISPWAYLTYREYGQPFYSFSQYYAYNFSWEVLVFSEHGNTRPSQFFTSENLPEIVRSKFKAILIVAVYSTMIVGLPLMVGFLRRLKAASNSWDRLTTLITIAFLGGTIVNIADLTQVSQLGRYYLPLFVLMIPAAVAGLDGLLPSRSEYRALFALTLAVLLWADPTWAHDFKWLTNRYQLHWPAFWQAGVWVRTHPEEVPPNARIVAWLPWEFRLASRRTTILMNRSLYPPDIKKTSRNYGATHVLWCSPDPPPHIDSELWGENLTRIRSSLGLSPANELYRSSAGLPFGLYPVALYRIEESDVERPIQ